jgi:predicted transcriptional regulator of viral defense system
VDSPADVQHGVVTRAQALASGLAPHVIDSNVHRGLWQRLQRRVYATFSGPAPRIAQIWAAVLAGDGAAASHSTAAELIGLIEVDNGPIHVSVPATRRVRRMPGAVIHLSARIDGACHPSRLPRQTRVEETVLDLADQASDPDRAIAWCSAA